MKIATFDRKPDLEKSKKLATKFVEFEKLLAALRKKEIPSDVINSINSLINELNTFSGSNKDRLKKIRKDQMSILKLVEKECKFVPKNHYRNRWLALGMAAFGIPLGVGFGVSLDNMAFLGIGIPIGLAIGIAIGTAMDAKALENGSQLDVEIK